MRAVKLSRGLVAAAAALAALMAGCRGNQSEEPPVALIRNMWIQPRYNPQSYSDFFEDHRTMRLPPEGTIARLDHELSEQVETGRLADESGYVLTLPTKVAEYAGGMEKLLARGEERYNIYCSPCHDKTGLGNGIVVQRGFQKPPSLHEKRIRQMPDGQLFVTIANGVRAMPSYAAQVPTSDRWAVVAYVRALELSQISQLELPK